VGQNDGDPVSASQVTALTEQIDQAELAQLKQLESQFEQLKQRDDEAAIQQLKVLQPKLEALAGNGGPNSSEALAYANNVSGAITDVRARADRKIADTAFQQAAQHYRQAAAINDKNGMTSARGELQSIVQAGGPHANDAQKLSTELNEKLTALNPPPAPVRPTVEPKAPPPAPVDPTVAVRAAIGRYASAFNHLDADALRQVWPAMGPQYQRYKTLFQEVTSIDMQVEIQEIAMSADKSTATVNALESQESKMKGFKPGKKQTRRVFHLSRVNGDWFITDVQ